MSMASRTSWSTRGGRRSSSRRWSTSRSNSPGISASASLLRGRPSIFPASLVAEASGPGGGPGEILANPKVFFPVYFPAGIALVELGQRGQGRRPIDRVCGQSCGLPQTDKGHEENHDQDHEGDAHHQDGPPPSATAHHPVVPARRHAQSCQNREETDPKNCRESDPEPALRCSPFYHLTRTGWRGGPFKV